MKSIYIIENTLNNKKYIGKTKRDLKSRFWEHCHNKNKTIIGNAIANLGENNFSIKLLEQVEDDIAIEKEKYYINLYNSIYPNGYNLMTGQSLKGGNNRMKGKHLPESWRNNCARKNEHNGMASRYYLKWLDTNEELIFNLSKNVTKYLNISISTFKKWLGKEHIDFNTKRPLIYYKLGRISDFK